MIELQTFVLAGKAEFTLTSRYSGKHYTFQVNKAKENPRYPGKTWFVNYMVSYDEYKYLGILKGDAIILNLTAKSHAGEESPVFKIFTAFWKLARNGAYDWEGTPHGDQQMIRFQHVGRCCVCARPLTNPMSIDMGIGPECLSKIGGE